MPVPPRFRGCTSQSPHPMITWSNEFATGVDFVDHDHQVLIDNLNRLEAALRDGEGAARIGDLVTFLERYAKEHFAREERCMDQVRCPVAAQNRIAHQEFIATIADAKDRLFGTNTATAVSIKVHREMCQWIREHILKIDTHLRACAKHPGAR